MNISERVKARLAEKTDRKLMQELVEELDRLTGLVKEDPVVQYPWIKIALKYVGLKEIPGHRHNPQILRWWVAIRMSGIRDDETPWCAAGMGGVLEEADIISSRKANARSYLKWGVELEEPAVGCIVIFWRGSRNSWKGHVGMVVGKDSQGRLLVWGCNQANAVNIKAFPRSRVLGYRWPKSYPLPVQKALPLGQAHLTTGEA